MLYRSHKNVDDVKIPYEFLQSYSSDIGGGYLELYRAGKNICETRFEPLDNVRFVSPNKRPFHAFIMD